MDTLNIILPVFTNIFDFISDLDSKFLFLAPAISLFTIFTVWRFLLSPFLGGSDIVKKKTNKSNGGN